MPQHICLTFNTKNVHSYPIFNVYSYPIYNMLYFVLRLQMDSFKCAKSVKKDFQVQ